MPTPLLFISLFLGKEYSQEYAQKRTYQHFKRRMANEFLKIDLSKTAAALHHVLYNAVDCGGLLACRAPYTGGIVHDYKCERNCYGKFRALKAA